MRRWVPAPLLFSLLSVALHLAWGWVMPRDTRAQRDLPPVVELELAAANTAEPEPEPKPELEPEPAKIATVAPTVPKPSRSLPKLAPPAPHVEQPAPAPAEPAPSVAVNEAPAPAPTPAVPIPNLSARAAALTLHAAASSIPAAHCSAERNAQAAGSCSPNDLEQTAQAELSRNLRAAASSIPHLSAREKPKLQPRSDGSYEYDGQVFRALLRRDGHVEFADSGSQVELRPSLIPFKATGDISDLVEKLVLGKELYSAEKLWFLDQTRELRDKLAAAYRVEEAARARRELEKQLQRILNDRGLGLAQKHGAVFALWQDCGDDEQAENTRRQVEAFVQRFMPRGSELGFEPPELDRFNAQRVGLRPFRPYPSNAGGSSG